MRKHWLVWGAAGVLTGCGARSVEPSLAALSNPVVTAELMAGGGSVGGFRARVTVSAAPGARGYVTLRNPCPAVLEVRTSDDAGALQAWSEWSYLLGCKSFPNRVTVAGDAPYVFETLGHGAAAILGDSLPPGRYWLWARVSVAELPSGAAVVPLGSAILQ